MFIYLFACLFVYLFIYLQLINAGSNSNCITSNFDWNEFKVLFWYLFIGTVDDYRSRQMMKLIGRDVENVRPNLEYPLGICLDRLRKTGLKPRQDRMCPG